MASAIRRSDEVRKRLLYSDIMRPELLPAIQPTPCQKFMLNALCTKTGSDVLCFGRHKYVNCCPTNSLGEYFHTKHVLCHQPFPLPSTDDWYASTYLQLFLSKLLLSFLFYKIDVLYILQNLFVVFKYVIPSPSSVK